MKKCIFWLPLLLCCVTAGAKDYPLKPFDSLFVRGKISLKAKQSTRNELVIKRVGKKNDSSLRVTQVKGTTFLQTNPYQKPGDERLVTAILYYSDLPKRLTVIQKASVFIDKVSSESLRISGSGDAFVKVTKSGKVKNLVVNLNRHSVADLDLVQANNCQLHVGKRSRLFKRCGKIKNSS